MRTDTMGKRIGDRALTPAERQRRRYEKVKRQKEIHAKIVRQQQNNRAFILIKGAMCCCDVNEDDITMLVLSLRDAFNDESLPL